MRSDPSNPTQWDHGQRTLAALGYEGFDVARRFRAWLAADKDRMKPRRVKNEAGGTREETRDEVVKRLAVAFCRKAGIAPKLEDAVERDPVSGKVNNPNGIKRARRVDMLEVWRKRGAVSQRGFDAGMTLRAAFEATLRGPSANFANDRVDSSPKPDHAVSIQIDRLSRFHRIHRHVREADREIIDTVVLRGAALAGIKGYRGSGYRRGLAHLHDALERLAVAMD